MTFILHTISSSPSRYAITPARFRRITSGRGQNRITIDDGFTACFEPLLALTPPQAARVTVFTVTEKIGTRNTWDVHGELANLQLMGWDQLRQLSRIGVCIGSHSATHPDLRNLNIAGLEREIDGSKKKIEDKLGIAVTDFCYPFGQYNAQIIEQVKRAGYARAFTTSDSVWEGFGNPYRTRRVEIKGTDPERMVWLKLSGLYDAKAVWELPALVWEKVTGKRKRYKTGTS